MFIEKTTILAILRERGLSERAEFVDRQLPDLVDSEQHTGLLAMLGLSPVDLVSRPS